MEAKRIEILYQHYRNHLLDDVVPFWLGALDRQKGGFFNSLDRDGSVFDTDKSMWLQARATWLFAELYNNVEQRQEWLQAARHGYIFLSRYGFDSDGRMFFATTRDGRPLRKRRYLFTESFGVIACAEYAQATSDASALTRARMMFRLMLALQDKLPPKEIPETRTTRAHAWPMILLATTQELRQADRDGLYVDVVDRALSQIFSFHARQDLRAVLETVGPTGEQLNSAEGRVICPGHALESAWFILREAQHRKNDPALIQRALEMIDWSLERGWDNEYGGLFYYVDLEGKPSPRLEWDMKLWWPHSEALYALLLAHHLSGEARYAEWYERIHEWTFAHFPDPEHGEWYGYLRRDGSISSRLKGNMWKGAFHVPRALLNCMHLLGRMAESDV